MKLDRSFLSTQMPICHGFDHLAHYTFTQGKLMTLRLLDSGPVAAVHGCVFTVQ